MNPSLHFLISLKLTARNCNYSNINNNQWNVAARQLADWVTNDNNLNSSFTDVLLFGSTLFNFVPYNLLPFYKFIQDASRAGKYGVDSKVYTSASLRCLKYLSRSCLGVPIHIHHTQRNLERWRNFPWHWRKHSAKLIFPQLNCSDFRYRYYPGVIEDYYSIGLTLAKEFWCFCKRAQQQEMYMDATHLALVFLCRTLPRSAKSDEMVAFMKAEKPFSQRALQFPAKLKRCKAAIATYLARMQSSTPEV